MDKNDSSSTSERINAAPTPEAHRRRTDSGGSSVDYSHAKPSFLSSWAAHINEREQQQQPPLGSPASLEEGPLFESLRIPTQPGRKAPFIEGLLKENREWARRMNEANPKFFSSLAKQQSPKILWIGCSDSRVPANQIVNLAPGEIFVHRNVANVFLHCDFNAISVLQYAVDVLKVEHIIVCGHYGCGGIVASTENKQYGIIDNWLRNIRDIYVLHRPKLEALMLAAETVEKGKQEMRDLLCELNVAHSVNNVCATTVVQNAWERGQKLQVHGWCYRLTDGIIRDLNLCISGNSEIESKIFLTTDIKTAAHM